MPTSLPNNPLWSQVPADSPGPVTLAATPSPQQHTHKSVNAINLSASCGVPPLGPHKANPSGVHPPSGDLVGAGPALLRMARTSTRATSSSLVGDRHRDQACRMGDKRPGWPCTTWCPHKHMRG